MGCVTHFRPFLFENFEKFLQNRRERRGKVKEELAKLVYSPMEWTSGSKYPKFSLKFVFESVFYEPLTFAGLFPSQKSERRLINQRSAALFTSCGTDGGSKGRRGAVVRWSPLIWTLLAGGIVFCDSLPAWQTTSFQKLKKNVENILKIHLEWRKIAVEGL